MTFKKKLTPQDETDAIVEAVPHGQNINIVFLKDYNKTNIAPGLNFKQGERATIDPNTFSNILADDPGAIAIDEPDKVVDEE